MADIGVIKEKLKEWKSASGQVRYYVNDWKDIIGLKVIHWRSGNVGDVSLNGEHISNNKYNRYIANTKVWFDEDAKIHVDYCEHEDVRDEIIEKVDAAFSKVE